MDLNLKTNKRYCLNIQCVQFCLGHDVFLSFFQTFFFSSLFPFCFPLKIQSAMFDFGCGYSAAVVSL